MSHDFKLKLTENESTQDDMFLTKIDKLDTSLLNSFSNIFVTDQHLTRKLVSFQANKTRAQYRWYQYKEAFSADLVEYLFQKFNVKQGKVLDPFAGVGTALFASSSLGYESIGIEVLPVGQEIIEANIIARHGNKKNLILAIDRWLFNKPWNVEGRTKDFEVLRITDSAYPEETNYKIKRYLNELDAEHQEIKRILFFSLLCILESISYTRKDGQYLRWDYRSGRREGKNTFNKGKILSFDEAIIMKLEEIKSDLELGSHQPDIFSSNQKIIETKDFSLLKGSCLDILPKLDSYSYSGIITSPPYCNRYDYTRTYALEHALLGINELELVNLRQAMLSCTVENKEKELLELNDNWKLAINICNNIALLQSILGYLEHKKNNKELNNTGISRMVRGYFYEMACVIQECYRVLNKGGIMFMVNDNVRYVGAAISVDTILSKVAEHIGFRIKHILVLPQEKGNSSQQMGRHGRESLRKCIYVWKKEK